MSPDRIQVLLRLTGDGVHPSTVDASVVAKVLALFEKVVLALADPEKAEEEADDEAKEDEGKDSDVTKPRGPAKVAVVGIEDRSQGLVLELDRATGDAPCRQINEASNDPDIIEKWPTIARKAFVDLTKYVTIGRMELVLEGRNDYALPPAVLHVPERYASGDPPLLTGPTTVVATLRSVGSPTKLKVPRRRRDLKVVLTHEQVKAVMHCVYEKVKVDGIAEWDPVTMEIRDLKVISIEPVVLPDIRAAFKRLRDISAGLWDDVGPEEYVRDLRDD